MTDPIKLHPPAILLRALLDCITDDITPLSVPAMNEKGTKLFGAAILLKSDLSLILAGTNHESVSPLNHGETWTVSQFFNLPLETRPNPKDCLFLSTHEPCSLCINAIVWSGFDNFVYVWDYAETDKLFGIPGDLEVWRDRFYHGPEHDYGHGFTDVGTMNGEMAKDGSAHKVELYKRINPKFVARSIQEILNAVPSAEREQWETKLQKVKTDYGRLSPTFCQRTGVTQ
ncbi:hypothetical protein LTR64_008672 [Lithohypha guttulata]|uniref:uncharacterized protein n=1 Tax=Lithohypha guttulata TaxID=1690604 RepID=UPI002DE0D4B0|nr:hypothetical protein LTR51_008722 [Lithohypha guttulata]